MKSYFKLVSLGALALSLSACSIHAKTDAAPAAPAEEKGIPGPDLTGTWRSDCNQDTLNANYKMFEATFRNSSVSRKMRTYGDANCTQLTNEKIQNGTYIFLSADKDGSFTIQYKFPVGGGWSSLPKEKVLLDAGTLYVSDYVLGEGINRTMMIASKKVAP